MSGQNEKMDTYGERLKDARINKALSQAALAKLVGCTQPTIFSIENDETHSTGLTVALSKILGVSPFWLEFGTLPREWKLQEVDPELQEAIEIFKSANHDLRQQMLGAIKALSALDTASASTNPKKRSA